ncbi:MAG: hypothetical protein WCK89_20135 [bacterium]
MMVLNPTYVVDAKQRRKSVLLPVAQWNRVVEALEELDDIRAYDSAKASATGAVPFEQAVREIEAGYNG